MGDIFKEVDERKSNIAYEALKGQSAVVAVLPAPDLPSRHRKGEWLTVASAARLLNVNTLWIYKLLWSGKLSGERVDDGRRRVWRVSRESVEARRKELAQTNPKEA
jgi:excisionase family DNA binding protein